MHDGGKVELQAWGIVQNLSGEDWKDVELALVAGIGLIAYGVYVLKKLKHISYL